MARTGGSGRSGSGGSLRTTFLGVALVIVVPFLLLFAYFGYSQIGREKSRAQHEALTQARALATQFETHLQSRLDGLADMGTAAASGGAPDALARRFRQSFPDVEQVLVLDSVGAVVAAAGQIAEPRKSALGDQEWFKRAATSTQPLVGEPRQIGPDVVLGLYTSARNADGQLRGVVAGDLVFKRIQDLLSRARLPQGAVVEVLSDRGQVVARHPTLFLMQDVQSLPGYGDLLQRQESQGELAFVDGERRFSGAVPLKPVPWTVVVGIPSAQVMGDVRMLLITIGAGAAAVTILALALALSLAGRASKGIAQLRAAMSRLERGDLPANVPIASGGEVAALTESFNRVVSWLRNKFREFEALSQVEEAAGAAIASGGGERTGGVVLPELLRKMVAGMGADAGAFVIQEESNLVTWAGVGFAGTPAEGVTLRRGQGLAGAVVGSREALLVPDVEADYRVEEPYIKAAGLRSVIAVPIVAGDRVLGAVEIGYRAPHEFSDADVQRLEAMARRTAQAVEHERALEDVRRNTEGLEARLAEQMEALQKSAAAQEEAKKQAREAQRQAHEMEQTMKLQASQVKEVIREKEVVRADPAAEEAKRVRAALQKTVSEELRVPLTALMDLPRFLVDGINKPLAHEAQQQLEVLHTRGEEVLELIDNLVTLSGLTGGQVKIAKAPFSLPELINRVVRSLQPRAAARGNRIHADIKPDVTQVVSDPKRVEQILSNLLLTSAKYTELGEIRITCFLKGPEVVLTVADDGAGFSTEEQTRIFEPFLQVGPREGRKFPGTGLLLTVCQRLVQLLGGKIKVESEVDRGTWFTVTLPVQS
jgi:signal transduction histidine kinase/HAMP domain-containing protein